MSHLQGFEYEEDQERGDERQPEYVLVLQRLHRSKPEWVDLRIYTEAQAIEADAACEALNSFTNEMHQIVESWRNI